MRASAGGQIRDRLDEMSGSKGFASGAVTGGLLGLLLGGNKMRKLAGGAVGYGGAAVIGALALQAYQNYQRQQASNRGAPAPANLDPYALPHAQPAADGSPFELTLVRAMVGAAKADGHIDAAEQRRLFAEVERLQLDAEAKAYVFDLLTHDVDLKSLVDAVAHAGAGRRALSRCAARDRSRRAGRTRVPRCARRAPALARRAALESRQRAAEDIRLKRNRGLESPRFLVAERFVAFIGRCARPVRRCPTSR